MIGAVGLYLTASWNGAELFIANLYILDHSTSAKYNSGQKAEQYFPPKQAVKKTCRWLKAGF